MPTFRHGKNTAVFVDEFDFTTYFNDATSTSNIDTAETSAFGTDAKTYIVGHTDGTISLSGMFEATASVGTDQHFGTSLAGSEQLVVIGTEGHAVGRRAVMMKSENTSYEPSSPIGDVVQMSVEFQADEGLGHGVFLSSGSSVSATGNGTSVDNSASSSNGGVGYLSVPVNTRNGNITVKIQHSADDSTFADLVTFTTVSNTTNTSQRVAVASGTTVNRYLRVNYTVAGSTGAATPVVAFTRR